MSQQQAEHGLVCRGSLSGKNSISELRPDAALIAISLRVAYGCVASTTHLAVVVSKASVSCALDLLQEPRVARQARSSSSRARSLSTQSSSSRKNRNTEVDKEFSSWLRQAEQQQALAREMIKTAREMVDRAIAMREHIRRVVLP